MDQYVFEARYSDDNGFIPELRDARELLRLFAQSPRQFEIIYCEAVESEMPVTGPGLSSRFLGFDAGDPLYSIVGDFPPDREMHHFFEALNENGLFDQRENARRYRDEYNRLRLADWSEDYRVWAIWVIE